MQGYLKEYIDISIRNDLFVYLATTRPVYHSKMFQFLVYLFNDQ